MLNNYGGCDEIGYNLLKIKDLKNSGIDIVDYIRNLNTGQSNWSNKDYMLFGKQQNIKIYTLIEEFKTLVTGIGKDSIVKVLFDNKKLKFNDINKSNDIIKTLETLNISELEMRLNMNHFIGIISSINDLFGYYNDNTSFAFIEGFTNFVLSVGLFKVTSDGFIKHLFHNVDSIRWDNTNPAPHKTPAWKSYFKCEWDDYCK